MPRYLDADGDGNPDLAGPDPERVVSPKAIAAAVAAFLIPTVLIVLDYLLGEGSGIFAGWHPVAQIAVFSLITSAITYLASWSKRDPLRR